MNAIYYIIFSLKTSAGFKDYGQYFLGDDRDFAHDLFTALKGNQNIDDAAMLHLDLMEVVNDLPEKIQTISCTLEEMGCNCKLIAKELFRIHNLEEL